MLNDRNMIDVASGGALMDKNSTVARNLISNMADSQSLKNRITKLTSLPLDNTILVHKPKCVALVLLLSIQLMHAPCCKKLNQIVLNGQQYGGQYYRNPQDQYSNMRYGSHPAQLVMPKKCNDLDTFFVPCTIGKCSFDVMMDLGTTINVMPSLVYKSLRLGALEPTNIVIQPANRNIAHPLGIVEDVLVQVSDMIFPTDFYVLDMKDELSSKGPTLILGRSFLKTTRTNIDVHTRTLFMEFGDNRVNYTIFDIMKHLIENHSIFYLDVID
ncbi:hypothetical protein CR513_51400, partial [Mucuna pruriens]